MDGIKKEQLLPNGSNCFWWSTIQHIRTNSTFYLLQAYSFRAVFEIVGEEEMVVVNIDRVDEGFDDLLSVGLTANVSVLEPADPVDNLCLIVLGTRHLYLEDA